MSSHPISQYLDDLKTVLLKPHSFFRRMPRNAGLAQPLAFALIAHWLGSALNYLWNLLAHRTTEQMFRHWVQFYGDLGGGDQIDMISRSAPWAQLRHGFMEWFWGVGSVIADPFITLAWLLITSFFVFLGARLFVGAMSDAPTAAAGGPRGAHEVTYESAVRILAYGTVASIFMGLPWVGGLIATLYGIYISMVGAKEVYRVGTARAILIVLFPKILVLGLFLSAFAAMALIALKFIALFLSGSL